MSPKGLTQKFLEGLASTFDLLNSGSDGFNLNPTTTVFSAFILTMVATFSDDYMLQTLLFSISFGFILLTRAHIYTWAKTTFLVTLWAIIVSIPIPIIINGEVVVKLSIGFTELMVSREGVNMATEFILRVLVSTSVLTSFTTVIGWRGIILGLEGLKIPKEITSLFKVSIINMPLVFRDASRMLSAREARLMGKSKLKESWAALSTVIGDLLIRGCERALRLEKAVKARSFVSNRQEHNLNAVGKKDWMLLSLTIFIFVFWLLWMR